MEGYLFKFRVDFGNGNCSSTVESFKSDGGNSEFRSKLDERVWRRVL